MTQSVYILAIESSCDDTAASVIKDGKIISNIVAGQAIHEAYGGVVPELASRAHQKNIVPVVDVALNKAGISVSELSAVAFTASPGLIGSLLVGAGFAKSMAMALNIPIISVHHMQAHVMAHFIDEPIPRFPFMCLTVSGGHTLIQIINSPEDIFTIGQTLDDAAGEAFDKCAKLLGLPYPGGPLIDKYAQSGNPNAFKFPLPATEGFNYSFSGLKTAFMNFLKKNIEANPDFINLHLADICASIQHAIIQQLIIKLESAAIEYQISEIGIAGGVSANSALRKAIQQLGNKHGWAIHIPKFEYCTDNAAMIAITAWYKYQKGEFADMSISPSAR
jgi:N6-L-threonylcarbamoyladenine synthase